MNNCPKCGNQVKSQAEFCPWCGYQIKQNIENSSVLSENTKVNNQVLFALFIIFIIIFSIIISQMYKRSYPSLKKEEKTTKVKVENKTGINNIDKWGLKVPTYIICSSACYTEKEAKRRVKMLKKKGYNSGYLWIPDYPSLSGTKMYVVYIGPFKSRRSCIVHLRKYQKVNPKAYAVLVSNKPDRVEIR